MRSRSAASVISRIAVASFAVCAPLASSSCAGVEDQTCTPDSNPEDRSDDCPFGQPGGPKVTEEACNTPAISNPSDPACSTTWAEVYTEIADPTTGRCGAGGCHGEPAVAKGIRLEDPTVDNMAAEKAYNTLQFYAGAMGTSTYISPQEPEKSWIVCNVKGTEGGGVAMPIPTLMEASLQELVATWVACGAKP